MIVDAHQKHASWLRSMLLNTPIEFPIYEHTLPSHSGLSRLRRNLDFGVRHDVARTDVAVQASQHFDSTRVC